MIVGELTQIWQYPVKSAGGGLLELAYIGQGGLAGDRCWAVLDGDNNEIRSAKRWPELLNDPGAKLHLYGKAEARPGRKMGHVTWLKERST